MKQFIIRLAVMAAMTAAIVACDKVNLDPAPDNGGNESIVELTLKNESAAAHSVPGLPKRGRSRSPPPC